MKIKGNALSKYIPMIVSLIPNKTSYKVLEGIKITATGDVVTLETNALDYGAKVTITDGVEVKEEGSTLIPAKSLSNIVNKLDKTITISTKDRTVTVSAGSARFKVAEMDGIESFPLFPSLNAQNDANTFDVPFEILYNFCTKADYFKSKSEYQKEIFTGIAFTINNELLEIVATDRHRLCKYTVPVPGAVNSQFVALSSKAILKALAKEDADNLNITFNSRHAVFKFGNAEMFTRLLTGEFFDYNATLNKAAENSKMIKVDSKDFLELLTRAELIAQSDNGNAVLMSPVKLKIDYDNKKMAVCSVARVGTFNECIAIETEDTGTLEIAFNNSFLIEAIRNSSSEMIIMQFKEPLSPTLISSTDSENEMSLILPVKTFA